MASCLLGGHAANGRLRVSLRTEASPLWVLVWQWCLGRVWCGLYMSHSGRYVLSPPDMGPLLCWETVELGRTSQPVPLGFLDTGQRALSRPLLFLPSWESSQGVDGLTAQATSAEGQKERSRSFSSELSHWKPWAFHCTVNYPQYHRWAVLFWGSWETTMCGLEFTHANSSVRHF